LLSLISTRWGEHFCCVRLSHALREGEHPITERCGYNDESGNPYIIKCATMERYLTFEFGHPREVTKRHVNYLPGILYFKDCGFRDATGHFTPIKDGALRCPGKENY
jgi:hypothetical protein